MNEHEEFIRKNYPEYPRSFMYVGAFTVGWLLLGAAGIVILTLWSQLLP